MFRVNGPYSGTDRQRAEALMDFYRDPEISAVFDLSGGDLAAGVLPYLDFGEIAAADKPLWGYSDLTSVLNAVYARTGRESVLYQPRHFLNQNPRTVREALQTGSGDLFSVSGRFLRGEKAEGILIGGNLRCFLKLAGTPWFPDPAGKILLLEARSGGSARIAAGMHQLSQMGVFRKAAGVVLGTFTQAEQEKQIPSPERILLDLTDGSLPVYKTEDVGHSPFAHAAVIGRFYRFS